MSEKQQNTAPDKLSLVVYSGDFDKVHYALVMASGAAAIGRAVTIFFTMGASRALLADSGDGRPGWQAMPVSDHSHPDGAAMDAVFAERGVGRFEELLEACVAMGATFMVCEMGLRAMDIDAADLRPDVPISQGGVVTFLNDASRDGAMLFV